MPTYDYECTECGHEFELFQKMTDPPRKRCPRCRGKVVRKLGTGAGIIFKGSGFYQTDYRSEEYRKREKAESSTAGASSGKPAEAPASPCKAAGGACAGCDKGASGADSASRKKAAD